MELTSSSLIIWIKCKLICTYLLFKCLWIWQWICSVCIFSPWFLCRFDQNTFKKFRDHQFEWLETSVSHLFLCSHKFNLILKKDCLWLKLGCSYSRINYFMQALIVYIRAKVFRSFFGRIENKYLCFEMISITTYN